MCVLSENTIRYPLQLAKEGYWKFQWGGEVSKAKIPEGHYETKLEFQEGWVGRGEIQTKQLSMGEVRIFSGTQSTVQD